MAIRFPDVPAAVVSAGAPPPTRWARVLRRPPAEPAAALPAQPVYTVGLDDLLGDGSAERSARMPPTWRFSRFGADGRAEAMEIADETDARTLATGEDHFGPAIREALAIAGEDARVRDGDYEARLFRVPALKVLALWLHAAGAEDLFVPIGPTGADLGRRVHTDEEFVAAVRAAATSARATYDAAENPDELGS
jgi:hypothetical protein